MTYWVVFISAYLLKWIVATDWSCLWIENKDAVVNCISVGRKNKLFSLFNGFQFLIFWCSHNRIWFCFLLKGVANLFLKLGNQTPFCYFTNRLLVERLPVKLSEWFVWTLCLRTVARWEFVLGLNPTNVIQNSTSPKSIPFFHHSP